MFFFVIKWAVHKTTVGEQDNRMMEKWWRHISRYDNGHTSKLTRFTFKIVLRHQQFFRLDKNSCALRRQMLLFSFCVYLVVFQNGFSMKTLTILEMVLTSSSLSSKFVSTSIDFDACMPQPAVDVLTLQSFDDKLVECGNVEFIWDSAIIIYCSLFCLLLLMFPSRFNWCACC